MVALRLAPQSHRMGGCQVTSINDEVSKQNWGGIHKQNNLMITMNSSISKRGSPVLSKCWQQVSMLVGRFAVSYRPERYYMRGPGPKYRERHCIGDTEPDFAGKHEAAKGSDEQQW